MAMRSTAISSSPVMICAPAVERRPSAQQRGAQARAREDGTDDHHRNERKLGSLCYRRSLPRRSRINRALRSTSYPELPSRSCQIIRQSRSVSPRSITCSGVDPSNCLFGRCSHSPITLPLIMSASASNSRVVSLIF